MDSMLRITKDREKYYTIGEFSKLLQIPISTLRYYDEKKILVPRRRDGASHYRYYEESQIYEALNLMLLRQMGMPLLEIKQILDHHTLETVERQLYECIQRCEEEIIRIQTQQRTIQQAYNQLKFGLKQLQRDPPVSDAEAEQEFQIYYRPRTEIISEKVTTDDFLNEAMITATLGLYAKLQQEQLQMNGPPHLWFVDHDPERFRTGRYQVVHFFPVCSAQPREVELEQFGGFYVLSCLHIGSYEQLPPVYQRLENYAEEQGLEINGMPFEEYLIYYSHTDDPQYYVTRISFPIADPSPGKKKFVKE